MFIMKKVYDKLIGFAELSLDVIGSIALGATVYVGSYSIINKICPEEMKALAGLGCAIISGYVALDRLLMKYRLKYLEDELKIKESIFDKKIYDLVDRIWKVREDVWDVREEVDELREKVDELVRKLIYQNMK